MAPSEQERTAWAISRLQTMPPERFYQAVILLSAKNSVSSVARLLLAFPDRGGLQSATFHTLRTYLTLLYQEMEGWLNHSSPAPPIVEEAHSWLRFRAI
jgi:hypothetical protein